MAIESLKDLTFSLHTDVWTFGVLLWEIFTLGQNPFSIYTYDESFVAKLEAGLRLELPKFATKEMYALFFFRRKSSKTNRQMLTPFSHL